MTSRYQTMIDRLGMSQLRAGRLFGVNERTSRRWAAGELPAPKAVMLVLWLMWKFSVNPDKVPDDL